MTPLRPKVSVSIVTYNHAKFIAQALDSALMQETNFDYEILVGEDDSSDGTREIVKAYAEQYPDKIRLFLNSRKDVIYINGRATGRWNLINNFMNTRGEYIALLEGDDYWLSPYKLQKQVEFLDIHKECSFCYHPVKRINEHDEVLNPRYGVHKRKDRYTFDDLLNGNFIPTCSVLFRSGIEKKLPAWFKDIPVADWVIHLLNARQGHLGYIDDVMGVYRMHAGGIWAGLAPLERAETDIKTFTLIGDNLGVMKNRQFRSSLAEKYLRLAEEYQRQRRISDAKHAAIQCFRFGSQKWGKKAARLLVDLYFPSIRRLRRVKNDRDENLFSQ